MNNFKTIWTNWSCFRSRFGEADLGDLDLGDLDSDDDEEVQGGKKASCPTPEVQRCIEKLCAACPCNDEHIANLPFADVSLFKQSGLSFIEPWFHKRKLHQCYNRHWRLWHASSNHSGGWWTCRTELVVWASHRCWKYASLLAIYAKHCRCFKGVARGIVALSRFSRRFSGTCGLWPGHGTGK